MIGIICGGGNYPDLVASACAEKNLSFCLVFLDNFCDETTKKNWPDSKSISASLGEVGKTVGFLKENNVEEVVFAGSVVRPDFSKLSLDAKGAIWLLKLGKVIFSGDDALLKTVATLLQEEGFKIIAGTDLLDDVFLSEGVFSSKKPSMSNLEDIKIGIKVAKKLGRNDLGQSVIVCDGIILGEEGIEGTDALIKNCANVRKIAAGGVLVKVAKPQQDTRLDLPTIGVDTIEILHKNGFNGIAVEAGKCIVVNKKEVIQRADKLGVFVSAVKSSVIKFFLIAGEASGDYLGGRLMCDICDVSSTNDFDIEFFGIGGQCMEKAGLKKLFSIDKLSIIGIFEVIGKIFYIKKLITETVNAICDYRPDVILTIDSSGFTHRIAKKIKKVGLKTPIIHYVSPPVWAWRPWRIKSMHKFIDKLMVLFPFETKYFDKLKTVFVGHPIAIDEEFNRPTDQELYDFQKNVCKIENKGGFVVVTLLPGSRASEINNHLPILEKYAQLMINKYKNVKFIIPTIEGLKSKIETMTDNWEQKPIVVSQKSHKVLSYYSSDLAIAVSGTVTLELSRVCLPFVVIYKTSCITYWIVKLLIRIQNVCLVNILAQKNIVPELLQSECTAENIFLHAVRILHSEEQKKIKESFSVINEIIKGKPKQAALEVMDNLTKFVR